VGVVFRPFRSASKLKFDAEGITATPMAIAAAPMARPLNGRNPSLILCFPQEGSIADQSRP
jgi:hypothetical protein